MKTAAELLKQATLQNPAIDNQFPSPYVVEAADEVINPDVPFTLELPGIASDAYTDVLLVFTNADGSFSPQAVVHKQAVNGQPTQGEVDNRKLSPPFDRDHSAVVQGFIRMRQTDLWQRTPDSVVYTF